MKLCYTLINHARSPQTLVAPESSILAPGSVGANNGTSKYFAQLHDSDTPSERNSNCNVSGRRKRKRELDDDHGQLKAEMTRLFTTLSASVTLKILKGKMMN